MFDRKDIAELKKDIVLDVELLNSRFSLHTRWGIFSPRSIDDGTLLLMKYIGATKMMFVLIWVVVMAQLVLH